MLIPVILSGGSGTRLWPLSRKLYPKQLLALLGEHSLLQETYLRIMPIPNQAAPIIVCNESHRFLVAEQMRYLNVVDARIILEPCARNTAPAIALAALDALSCHDDPTLLVLPADHLIQNTTSFQQVVTDALTVVDDEHLCTFGITPQSAHTGYGYIKAEVPVDSEKKSDIFSVRQFVEKPNQDTAQHYYNNGHYYWNSGMFLFKAKAYLKALALYAPQILEPCQKAYQKSYHDLDFIRIDHNAFKECPSDSIDYAVMEPTDKAWMIPLSCGWSDVGCFASLWQCSEQDEYNNVCHGDVLLENSQGCYIRAQHRLVAALGVDNLVVIETADAVLVARRDQAQHVKKIVEKLEQLKRSEVDLHQRVYRPWGSYETIDVGSRFKVKRIRVNPKASLSLQKHQHRAEHWVVVVGEALVQCEEERYVLQENQSTYIPKGAKHRLTNLKDTPLEMIEIQSGCYLGEDDIIRIADNYGRMNRANRVS